MKCYIFFLGISCVCLYDDLFELCLMNFCYVVVDGFYVIVVFLLKFDGKILFLVIY